MPNFNEAKSITALNPTGKKHKTKQKKIIELKFNRRRRRRGAAAAAADEEEEGEFNGRRRKHFAALT